MDNYKEIEVKTIFYVDTKNVDKLKKIILNKLRDEFKIEYDYGKIAGNNPKGFNLANYTKDAKKIINDYFSFHSVEDFFKEYEKAAKKTVKKIPLMDNVLFSMNEEIFKNKYNIKGRNKK